MDALLYSAYLLRHPNYESEDCIIMDRYGAQRCFADGDRVSWAFEKIKSKKGKLMSKQTVVMKRVSKNKRGQN